VEGLEKKRTNPGAAIDGGQESVRRTPRAIRADKARLDDLAIAVPDLQSLLGLRDKIAGLEPKDHRSGIDAG